MADGRLRGKEDYRLIMTEFAYRHKSLRNPNINYRSGWWSVSIQVAKNLTVLARN